MKVLTYFGHALTSHPQLITGSDFVLAAPDHVPAIFGRDSDVLWAEGEALFIVGPQGTGKTTLMQQIALRRAGVLKGELIGFPVKLDAEKLTLYFALDRPRQIARSFKRMVTDAEEQGLGYLAVWKGPLPFDVVKDPEKLVLLVQDIGEMIGTPVGTVCVDSLKDIASPLSSDEVGAAVNRAVGGVIARDIEVVVSHHQRKANSENKKPKTLADVYGSTWITAGAGSVALLWGEPGDPLVELTHLKQPADEVGPLELAHDHEHGVTTRRDSVDAWTLLQGATAGGTTVADVAQAIYGINPTKAQVEKARRKLDKFVAEEHAVKIEPSQITEPTLYRPTVRNTSVSEREPSREQITPRSRMLTNGSTERHDALTQADRSGPPPTGEEDRDRVREVTDEDQAYGESLIAQQEGEPQ